MKRTTAFLVGFLSALALAIAWSALKGSGSHGIVLTGPGSVAERASSWKLSVNSTTGQIELGRDGAAMTPLWKLDAGWFVWVENDERAWWFNGVDSIVLVAFEKPARLVLFSPDNPPAPPPDGFIERLGRARFQKIAEASAESKRRLGIGP